MIKIKAKEHIENLVDILTKFGYKCGEIAEKQYNFETDVIFADAKFKLLVYFGKKGIRTVVQGNRNLPEFQTLNEIATGELNFFEKEFLSEEPESYIGTDETGKGDIFGPLVVAGVYVNGSTKKELKKIGVKDSKELTDNVIWEMAKKIPFIDGIKYKVISLEPAEYNKLFAKHRNINSILDEIHSDIVSNLLSEVECDTVITDKFHTKDIEIAAVVRHQDVKFISVNKAEKYIGVAAASVLARAKMIQWFKKHKLNGIVLPKGTSEETIAFIKAHAEVLRETDLAGIAKLHFKTWEKLNINPAK